MTALAWRAPASRLLVLAGIATGALLAAGAFAEAARAHGGSTSPPQRTYMCRFLDASSPMCQQAWQADPQALYDWMEVNIGDAAGRHREMIPDGKLCSAGRAKYAAFDIPTDRWVATPMRAGRQALEYTATAPHATKYFKYYLTRDGYQPTDPLRWDDLVEIYDSGPRFAEPKYNFEIDVPARQGRHVLFIVWQRSDSPEAFYSCSDVDFGGVSEQPGDPGGEDPGPQPGDPGDEDPVGENPGDPGDDDPAGEQPGEEEPSGPVPGAPVLKMSTTTDWGGGYCADVTVRNPDGDVMRGWKATMPSPGKITSIWNATAHPDGDQVIVQGAFWNADLAGSGSTSFGFCADRSAPPNPQPQPDPDPQPQPQPDPDPDPQPAPAPDVRVTTTVTSDWGSGYCAAVEVSNTTGRSVEWAADVPVRGSVTSLWDAVAERDGNRLQARGAAWNRTLAAGAATQFGFCASA